MKILHTYCLNHNIGDYYLGIGVKNLLRNYLDVELIAETNLQGTVFNEYYIDNVVNKKYDLLVIGGGGIIHGSHWPNGWFWLIKQELIKRINIPFIVYGVGYNYFQNEGGISEIGKSHLLETIQRSAYFSVRNDGSAVRLYEQIGVDVPAIPDPGFHINLNRNYQCDEKKPFILVQLANDKPELRFSGSLSRQAFIEKFRLVITQLSKKYKVILAPHVYEDIELSQQVSIGLENVSLWDFRRFSFDRAIESIGYYEKAEFVIAMRGHGQIIPIAFNTPVISLENHPKHRGLMEALGIQDYNVSLSDSEFEKKLLSAIDNLEINKNSYQYQLEKANIKMAQESEYAFIDILKNLNKKPNE